VIYDLWDVYQQGAIERAAETAESGRDARREIAHCTLEAGAW
jgi:hypothetical protein